MTASDIIAEIKPLGRENYKRILLNHGIKEPCFGVKIEELKKIQKRIKVDYQLALDLYDTGIYDAMYLAGLIADDEKMTKRDLRRWVEGATSTPLCGSTVAWVAAGGKHGWDVALEWIDSKKEHVASAGWTTLTCLVSLKDNAELDLPELEELLRRVERTIHHAPNGVRSAMNLFVIALGAYVRPLAELAVASAEKIGKVSIDMGDTACKVPFAPDYIRKTQQRGSLDKKRKTVKC